MHNLFKLLFLTFLIILSGCSSRNMDTTASFGMSCKNDSDCGAGNFCWSIMGGGKECQVKTSYEPLSIPKFTQKQISTGISCKTDTDCKKAEFCWSVMGKVEKECQTRLPSNQADEQTAKNQISKISETTQVEKKPTYQQISGKPLSIDLEATVLKTNYTGDNSIFEGLYEKLEKASKKDEYESTSDYISRLTKQSDETIYAFYLKDINRNVKYNADSRQLAVKISFSSVYPIISDDHPHLGRTRQSATIKSELNYKEDYVGSNAFGKRVNVERLSWKDYSLAVNNDVTLSSSVSINMEPDDARILGKDNLGVFLVCKLHKSTDAEPIAFTNFTRTKPTVDSPKEYITTDHLIDVDLYQIWIYDKRSGKVLTKHVVQS